MGPLVLPPGQAWAADKVLQGVGFDERLSGAAVLADAMEAARMLPRGVSLNARVIVERAEVERQPGVYDFAALDARVARYRSLDSVRLYVDFRDTALAPDALEDWGRLVRALASRYHGVVRGYIVGVQPQGAARPPSREQAFFIKTTAVNLRAADADAATILGGIRDADAEWLATFYGEDTAPYVDGVGLMAGSSSQALLDLVDQHDPTSTVVLLGESLAETPDAGATHLLNHYLAAVGTRVSGVTYAGSVAVVEATLRPLTSLRVLLEQDVVLLDEKAVGLRLTQAAADVTSSVAHRLVFGVGTLTNYLIYTASTAPLELSISDQSGTRPVIVDALGGTRAPAPSFRYDSPAHRAVLGLPATTRTLIVDWNTGDSSVYALREDVSSTALPSVADIIARHQQVQAAQEGLLASYVVGANMAQRFRSTGVDSGFDVITENRMFVEGRKTEWEELSFSLNGTKWGPNRPAFPLLQAEKVLSLPFDLRLDADYRYRLVGVEDVDGRPCFALRFDPVDEQRSLYRGTVWIDRETYVKVKAQTVQTRLVSPVLSSEEIHYFGSAGDLQGRHIHLLMRLVGRQIMLIAGRNLLVERTVRFDGFQLNPPDFEAQREAARASDRIMYRDTDDGLRYLAKRGGQRVVQDATTTAIAALAGVTYDPAYDYPLPLAGINYLDFNFLGKDTQLAVVFGGVLALVNVQRAKLLGPRIDGSLDLFAIAVKGNDRAYDASGELAGQRLNTRPVSTGINLGWQMTQFQKIVANYVFRYDSVSADATSTSPLFRPPVSTVTNGVGLSWEWKQRGYSFQVGGTRLDRMRWEPWGAPGDYRASDKRYVKYSASLTKDFFSGFHKVHLNTAYYGGRRLDRFSAYQFGFFDENRIHGVPSAGVRFGELAMFRGSYAFNVFEQHRLELFLDQAYGRDYRLTTSWQALTGIGVGGNTRGPFGTLLRGDVGRSFLPSRYRGAGSLVLQVQVLKPL